MWVKIFGLRIGLVDNIYTVNRWALERTGSLSDLFLVTNFCRQMNWGYIQNRRHRAANMKYVDLHKTSTQQNLLKATLSFFFLKRRKEVLNFSWYLEK